MNPARRYAQATQETASPERLMVLLFEAALRHMRGAAAALEAGRPAGDALVKAGDIVAHLDATFDRARAPELAENLGAVYRFTCQRLVARYHSAMSAIMKAACTPRLASRCSLR